MARLGARAVERAEAGEAEPPGVTSPHHSHVTAAALQWRAQQPPQQSIASPVLPQRALASAEQRAPLQHGPQAQQWTPPRAPQQVHSLQHALRPPHPPPLPRQAPRPPPPEDDDYSSDEVSVVCGDDRGIDHGGDGGSDHLDGQDCGGGGDADCGDNDDDCGGDDDDYSDDHDDGGDDDEDFDSRGSSASYGFADLD